MERKPFTVVIEKKHCDSFGHGGCANYVNNTDCPLYRAIKEQHPDFPLTYVESYGVLHTETDFAKGGWHYDFSDQPNVPGWGWEVADRIADGKLESYTVTIRPSWSYAQAEAVTVTL
jgi:hypothetical protein